MHSDIHRDYRTSRRQKLSCTPLVTHNIITTTEFRKTRSYNILYNIFQVSSHIYTLQNTDLHTHSHTHTHTHTYTHSATKNTSALINPWLYSHQLYSHDIVNTKNLAKIEYHTWLNDFNSFGSGLCLQLHTQQLGIRDNSNCRHMKVWNTLKTNLDLMHLDLLNFKGIWVGIRVLVKMRPGIRICDPWLCRQRFGSCLEGKYEGQSLSEVAVRAGSF